MISPGIFSVTSKNQRIDVMQQKLPEIATLMDSNGNKFVVNLAVVFNEQYANGYIVEFEGLSLVEYKKQLELNIKDMQTKANSLKQKIDSRTGISKILNLVDSPRLSIAKNSINTAELQLPKEISKHKGELNTNVNSFRKSVSKIDNSLDETTKIKKQYQTVFNGAFLETDAKTAMKIAELKGVKSIKANKKVNVVLNESSKVINADDVWQTIDDNGYNITGFGVKVAVIDTGVDYTHPDLGGCFGQGCKVEVGYDFINNDNDPMDDQGHGTHVAATIAGINTILKGIAPDAKIYAYKVLDSSGSGGSDGIISAMEYCADPNQDGNFSDHVDIASLSLGGNGDPDDPMSQAVDGATDAGVLLVIAAGNSGPDVGSVESPGTARKALTVAASNKCDELAGFSSRGPVVWNNGTLLKPDIMAPGVSICAAQYDSWFSDRRCLDNEHIAISGTSMATPHVSGVAALLKQKYPNLSPTELKSLLKQTSYNLGYTLFEQGNGRLDAKRAIEAKLIVTPNSFSDDFTEKTQATWTLNIKNIFNNSVLVTIKYPNPKILNLADVTPTTSINITIIGPTSLNLDANSIQSFDVNITSLPSDFEGYLLGEIQISDGSNIYSVPYPASLSGVVSAGGSVDTGTHYYYVTYTTAAGETNSRISSVITTTAGNNTVTLTIPVSTDPRVTGRKLYRTKAGGLYYNEYYLATIANNTDVSYIDTVADSTLTGNAAVVNTRGNTTSYGISVNGTRAFLADAYLTAIGRNAGGAVTSSAQSTYIGSSSGRLVTTGNYNTSIGYNTLYTNVTGSGNTALGTSSLNLTTSNYNTGIGSNTLQTGE